MYELNQVVIYEGRRCQIIELTDCTAKLKNLTPINDCDWTIMEVKIVNMKEETEV